jgi:hypothetical protein
MVLAFRRRESKCHSEMRMMVEEIMKWGRPANIQGRNKSIVLYSSL